MQNVLYLLLIFLFLSAELNAQNYQLHGTFEISPDFLKETGRDDYDTRLALKYLEELGPGWGYNFDSLQADLKRWSASPFVTIDSIGTTVQNRPLWSMTISDSTDLIEPVFRIAIHARTHPQEVQSTWVTNEMIRTLISDEETGKILRRHCIINIIPMYNPDGVELGYPRQNANSVDLESNWSATSPEPEVQAIRSLYERYMASVHPIRIALNMHSSSRGVRYFVYHHENGTSPVFAAEERMFINMIQSHWPEGIAGWDEFISWTTGTPDYYPESWFWLNYGENVMALTYEDIYGETSYGFDHAASAILNGIIDFLEIRNSTDLEYEDNSTINASASVQVYPNPVYSSTSASNLHLSLSRPEMIMVKIYDVLGRLVLDYPAKNYSPGTHKLRFNPAGLPNGYYFYRVTGPRTNVTIPMLIIR